MPIFAIAGFLAGRPAGEAGEAATLDQRRVSAYLPTATVLSQSAMSAAAAAAAASAAAEPEPEPPNAVPPAAVRWISSQLSGGGRAAADRASYLPARGLDALQVKDLRALCGTLESLLGDASCSAGSSSSDARTATATASASADARARFRRPKSGSKKAAWIAAVRRCFYADAGCAVPAPSGDPIWALLLAGSNDAAATAPAAPDAPAALNNNGTTSGGFAHASLFATAASPAALALAAVMDTTSQVPYPPRAVPGSSTGNASARQRGAAAPAGAAGSRKRPAPSSRSPPPPFSLPQPAAEPDRVDFFVPEAQWPPPNTTGGLRMLVQIKQEGHRSRAAGQQASSSAASSTMAAAAATSAASEDYYDDHPRNAREMSLLGQLRTMGFTDQREMLAGLRHVVEDGSGGGGNGTCGGAGSGMIFDTGTVLEGAMMWIISQREEAEEARKMDLVRIVAENEQVEEERRRREAERRLEEAPIEDIVGAGEGEGGSEGSAEPSPQAATPSKHKAGRSKHFHFSALLHSTLVRGVFLSISCPEIKKELVRLLRLEQNAHQWYGSVLPWAYFTYVATGRIEKWANDESSSSGSDADVSKGEKSEKAQEDLVSLIRNEANILERALFTLSEQHDNGLQNVPKIFIAARDNCAKKGLPDGPEGHATGDKSAGSDDDDVVLVGTIGGPSKNSFNDDDDLDRKPAARPVASPNVSSRSPRRNCASSDRKKPAKASSEVIEIM